MNTVTTWLCGTCGAPATHAVRDITDVTQPGAQYKQYEARGDTRYGCDTHRLQAGLYDTDGNLLGVFPC